MDSLKERFRERCLDVCEWVDYRPDPDLGWLAAIPVLLVFGWLFGSAIGLGMAVAIALLVTLFVAVVGLLGMALWVVANAALDFTYSVKLSPKPATARTRTLTN